MSYIVMTNILVACEVLCNYDLIVYLRVSFYGLESHVLFLPSLGSLYGFVRHSSLEGHW